MRENYKTIYAGGEGEIPSERTGNSQDAVMTGSRQELQDGLCWM